MDQPAQNIHNFVRGLDSSPGAIITLDGKETKVKTQFTIKQPSISNFLLTSFLLQVFGSTLWTGPSKPSEAREVDVNGKTAVVTSDGLLLTGSDGKAVNVSLLSVEGKFVKAGKYGLASDAGNFNFLDIKFWLLFLKSCIFSSNQKTVGTFL